MIFANVTGGRDYTRSPIHTPEVARAFAEPESAADGLVTLSVCGHKGAPCSEQEDRGIGIEGTYGFEFDMTPEDALALAQSLINAADQIRR